MTMRLLLQFMSLPDGGASKYYVGAVNHFGDLNGFELLIQRLDQRVRVVVVLSDAIVIGNWTRFVMFCDVCTFGCRTL